MNTLVFMLVAILLPTWILGTLYLSFFPASATASGSPDSQLAANADSATDPSALTDATENDSQDNTASNGQSGGDFDPGRANIASGLTSDQTAAYDAKITTLQEQLDAKSLEFDQLRKSSMSAAMSSSGGTADTSKFENQIADLTQERDQLEIKLASAVDASNKMDPSKLEDQITALTQELDQQIRTLEEQTTSQKLEIQTLQDRLASAEQAKRDAETQLAAARSESTSNPADPSPALAGSTGSNQSLEFREWVSSRGSKARLAFVRWEDNRVIVVNEAGKEFRLSLNRLSPTDQTYVDGKR